MPWQEMRRGPASGRRSLLLDYVSPIMPISVFEAIKMGHWVVVASSVGFMLLKLTVRGFTPDGLHVTNNNIDHLFYRPSGPATDTREPT